jgi:hypothetical protein
VDRAITVSFEAMSPTGQLSLAERARTSPAVGAGLEIVKLSLAVRARATARVAVSEIANESDAVLVMNVLTFVATSATGQLSWPDTAPTRIFAVSVIATLSVAWAKMPPLVAISVIVNESPEGPPNAPPYDAPPYGALP